MSLNDFHPNSVKNKYDQITEGLKNFSEYTLAIVLGLLPVLIIPSTYLSLGYGKSVVVALGVLVSVLVFLLYLYRREEWVLRPSLVVLLLVGVCTSALVSTFYAGDFFDSLVGESYEVYTVFFLGLLTIVVWSVKNILSYSTSKLLGRLLLFSAGILAFFHVLQIYFAGLLVYVNVPVLLSMQLLGSWNTLALFSTLVIVISLLTSTLANLSLKNKVGIGILVFLNLAILIAVNFIYAWVLLGIFAFVNLFFLLRNNNKKQSTLPNFAQEDWPVFTLLFTIMVSSLSLLFLFFGSAISDVTQEYTNLSITEVRPSLVTTLDIANQIDSPLVGVGPNKFVDAWLLHKPAPINETVFWDTDFSTGNSYLLTLYIENGVIGLTFWLLFLGVLLYYVVQYIREANQHDAESIMGYCAITGALYVWCITLFYTPGVGLLLLGAVCTGLFLGIRDRRELKSVTLELPINKKAYRYFYTMLCVLVMGLFVLLLLQVLQKLYLSHQLEKEFVSLKPGSTIQSLENKVLNIKGIEMSHDSLYTLAQLRLEQLEALLNTPNPAEAEQASFTENVTSTANLLDRLTDTDPTDARGWELSAEFFIALAQVRVEGALERADEVLERWEDLDPKNPKISLLRARLALSEQDLVQAREYANEALALRNQYVAAIALLVDLDVAEGQIESAISRTISALTIMQDNPARWYQLALLYKANQQANEAISALENAVALSPEYANARYELALLYVETGQTENARQQLEALLVTNQENENLRSLLRSLDSTVDTAGSEEADSTTDQTDQTEPTAENE